MFLSVISPVYKADGILLKLTELISKECNAINITYEIILVNDGSPDNSWEIIKNICKNNKQVTGINLSKNFGQHSAINAGLSLAKGDFIIVMDCDMQHHPKYIPALIKKMQEGNDIVFTVVASRQHSFFKNFFSKMYHHVYNYLAELNSDYKYATYSIISSKVLKEYISITDYHSHYLPKLKWLGFKQASVQIEHYKRESGKSSYTFRKLFIAALNGITSHSTKLLRLNVFLGIIISFISFIGIGYIIFIYFTKGFLVGWASIATLILFSLGILLTSIGITGIYIGQTFEQVKKRPPFIIDSIYNEAIR
jgi:polyisoprenyl-phosphate glycosyltransferase